MDETSETKEIVQRLAETMQGAWDSAPAASWADAARAVLASRLVVPKVMLDVVEAERADYLAQLNQLTSNVLDLTQQWDDRAAELGLAGLGVATQLRALTQQQPR